MIKTLLRLSFATCLLLTVAGQAQARTLKIATIAPDGTTWMTELRKGAKEIAERTEDRVKLKFYPGGIMGSDAAVLKKMRIGQLHGGALVAGSLADAYVDSQIYSMPFIFRSFDEVDYVRQRMDELIKKGLEDSGYVVLGLSEGGFAYLVSNKPVRRVEDLHGQKAWVPEGDLVVETIYETAGISPVPLPIADVYTGLQTGLIDTIGTTPSAAIAFQWHTKMKYLTDIPLLYVTGMLVVDKKAFKRLSPADQAVVREVMGAVFATLDKMARKDNVNAAQALQQQGIEFVELSPEDKERWQSIADDSIEALRTKGLFSKEMFSILQNHLKDYRSQENPAVAHAE